METVGADLRVRPHPQGAFAKIRMASLCANFGLRMHKKTAPKKHSVRSRKNMGYGW